MATIAIPDAWIENRGTNRQVQILAGQLTATITPDNLRRITTGTGGSVQDSLYFHDYAAGAIAELDTPYLDAIGLPHQPLLTQSHTLRSDSTWRLGAAR